MDDFSRDIDALQVRLRASVNDNDLRYIRNAEWAGRICSLVGFATAWIVVNPISIVLIAVGQLARWGIAHHILHRAFDGIDGVPRRLNSRYFGRGWRRLLDWNEWMIPAAFQHEHNVHHAYTGGGEDPDVVEANVDFIRRSTLPRWCKYLTILLIACTWRLTYYAPGTFIQLRRRRQGLRPTRYEFTSLFIFANVFNPFSREGMRFWAECILPCGISRFLVIPVLFIPFLGFHFAMNVFWTIVAAEVLTNLYTFILIASSHTGEGIFRFDVGTKGRPEFYRRQLLGTVNYTRGPALRDFLQAWINYQIEHHLFPNLPPSKYVESALEVQAICQKHNVPYTSEPLHRQMWNMIDIVVGKTSMPHVTARPQTQFRGEFPSAGSAASEPNAVPALASSAY